MYNNETTLGCIPITYQRPEVSFKYFLLFSYDNRTCAWGCHMRIRLGFVETDLRRLCDVEAAVMVQKVQHPADAATTI